MNMMRNLSYQNKIEWKYSLTSIVEIHEEEEKTCIELEAIALPWSYLTHKFRNFREKLFICQG